ncbi:hypothetical protein SAMN05444389_101427 [Paracoccus solventivorans]|uniref:Uncharacterized protein n=1 Tax=Paracoccus solventivorans TaxID=53463 RepID=A0A1M7DLK9_9RHOB|nr:hypothetical protein SAMN05444389_101427 [Paracoccus solventivorans]
MTVKAERNILKPTPGKPGQAGRDLDAERQRLAAIIAAATPPTECGPDIVPAPARGRCVLVPHIAMAPSGTDARGEQKWVPAATGYGHRASVRQMDVFDRMVLAARRGRRPAPLTPGQIAVARRYRDLVERHDAGGIRCSDLDRATGDGTGRDFMDAYLAEGREIEAIRRRIGGGASLAVRRIRPSTRGGPARRAILDRALVDMVCLGDRTLSEVLRGHGWQVDGRHRAALTEALSGALDRMIGYRGKKTS